MTDQQNEPTPEADFPHQELAEKICGFYIKADQKMQQAVHDVPEDVIFAIADYFEDNTGCQGFRSLQLDIIAEKLRGEVALRRTFARAHEKGEGFYCMCCDGMCKSTEEHEANAARRFPPRSPEVMRIHEMKHDDLIAALIEARGLNTAMDHH